MLLPSVGHVGGFSNQAWPGQFELRKEGFPVAQKECGCTPQLLRLSLDDQREIEKVTGSGAVTPVIQLLCDDLGRGLNPDVASGELPEFPGLIQEIRRRNKVDFAFVELELHK
jgi:hypothetical protein